MTIKKAYFPEGVEKAAEELEAEAIRLTKGTGASGGIIGLSGGIDSTTVAYICKNAFDKNNQNQEERELGLYGLIMPSNANSSEDELYGVKVAEDLGINYKIKPIEPFVEFLEEYAPEALPKFPEVKKSDERLHRGNTYSELRALLLSRIAAPLNYRVMGTGNRDEDYVLGYFTKRGDGDVDNNLIGKLPKRLVREIARYYEVPEDIVERKPTAGLWKKQTDENELGYNYSQTELVQNGLDENMSIEEIAKETGIEKWIVKDIKKRHKTTEHKRNPPEIGEVSLNYK